MFQQNSIPNNLALRKPKRPFTREEDQKIILSVSVIGTKNWALISNYIGGRTPKQCRDRYMNYLKPGLSSGEWTPEEDNILLKLYERTGPKWGVISKFIKSRNQISIKNRFIFLKRTNNNNYNNNVDCNSSITNNNFQIYGFDERENRNSSEKYNDNSTEKNICQENKREFKEEIADNHKNDDNNSFDLVKLIDNFDDSASLLFF